MLCHYMNTIDARLKHIYKCFHCYSYKDQQNSGLCGINKHFYDNEQLPKCHISASK